MHGQHHQEAVGTAIGGVLGFLHSAIIASHLDMGVVVDTAILSAVGATVGFVFTTFLKWIKTLIKKS